MKTKTIVALALGVQLSALGANISFNGTPGSLWSDPVNWGGGVLPGTADRAQLIIGGRFVTVNSTVPTVNELRVSSVGTAPVVDLVAGGDLTVNAAIFLGGFATGQDGEIRLNGGTLTALSVARFGDTAGSSGTLTVNSGTWAQPSGTLTMGYNGNGTLVQNGGAVNITGGNGLRIGDRAGSTGTATINGGVLTMSAGRMDIGFAGNGTLTINNGSVVVRQLYINGTSGLAGVDAQVDLLGGTLEVSQNVAGALTIGGDDTLNIEGGTLLLAGDRLSKMDGLVGANSITWANGQAMLGSFDSSWTNGTSVLYADYNTINVGQTTVWATSFSAPPSSPDAALAAMGYLVVTNYPGVKADGTGDSTAGIQQAIDEAYAQKKTVFFPSGTYIISDVLKCYTWQLWDVTRNRYSNPDSEFSHVLWGSYASSNRPVLKLAAGALGFGNAGAPRSMISFRNFRANNSQATTPVDPAHPLPSNPQGTPVNFDDIPASLFLDNLRGIDFDCNGHAGAVGIYFVAAQGATLEDVRVDATGAHTGIWGVPGRNSGGMNLEVEGGRTGIRIEGSIAGTMLVGIRLFNQTETALTMTDFSPATLVGFHIKKATGPVLTLSNPNWANAAGTISLLDGRIELENPSVALANSAGVNLYLRNVYLTGTDQVTQSPAGMTTATGLWKRVREYAYTDQTNPAGDPPYEVNDGNFRIFNLLDGVINRVAEPATDILANSTPPPVDLMSRHIYADLPAYEGQAGTIDITQAPYNAVADDGLDDRLAIQSAIDAASALGHGRVFVPSGTFELSNTLMLRTNTVLFGIGRTKSILTSHVSWKPLVGRVTLLETEDDATATTFLGFLTLLTRTSSLGGSPTGVAPPSDRFDSVRWKAGRNSCYYGIHLPTEWINRPTNPHHVIEITGNGGGRFYFMNSENSFNRAHADYRFLYVEGTQEPLWFYGVNTESTKDFQLWGGDPCDTNIEIVDSQNISLLSIKREGVSPSLILQDSQNIAVYSSGAMREGVFLGSEGYIQIYGTSDSILMANLLVQLTLDPTNTEPLLREALAGGTTNEVMWPEGVSLYHRGIFNDVAVSLAIDADEDGMPSDWENTYGLDALDPQDAFLNADGDTLNNSEEYIAGTDPQDAASNFSAALPSSGVGVAFESTLGRLYSVEGKADLLESSWSLLTQDWPGTGGVMEYDDSLGTNQFYRINVMLP